MKWLMAHYHACCAVARVQSIERAFDRFRSRIYGRMQNFNVWLDSTVQHLEQTRAKVDKVADDVDLLDAGQRHLNRDMVDMAEQIVLLNQRIDNLNRCIEIQNVMNQRIESQLESMSRALVARPYMADFSLN